MSARCSHPDCRREIRGTSDDVIVCLDPGEYRCVDCYALIAAMQAIALMSGRRRRSA